VNGNVKLGRAAARSGEWAQHFSNASCCTLLCLFYYFSYNFHRVNDLKQRLVNIRETAAERY